MPHHKWYMSWPGNWCTKCGADDPMELAIGDVQYDPYEDKWLTEEAKQKFEAACVCPVEDK